MSASHEPARMMPAATWPSTIMRELREAPTTVPMLGVVVLLVAWQTSQAGYPLTHWAPGGLIVIALLAIALWNSPLRWRQLAMGTRVALACLAAFTALSFLSILWAGVSSDAWEGADRTLLYLLVFALFASWPQRGHTAALLLCTWALASIGVVAFVAVHLYVAAGNSSELASMLPGGRLIYPAGYANAAAAQWMIAAWPALLLARAKWLHWGLRGVLAGGCTLLAEVALLSQSRGSLFAVPVMLVLVLVLLPGRSRTFLTLIAVAGAIAAATPTLLHVGDHIQAGHGARQAIHAAGLAMLLTSLGAALVVGIGARIESRLSLSENTEAKVRRGVGAIALGAALAAVLVGLSAVHDPIGRVKHEWNTFTSGSGYAANSSGNRLISGLGSNRYDFYRVAIDELLAHPLLGIGADNYAQQYLRHGRSEETPKYPHSVELRTLAQSGILGALIALIGLAGALLAACKALWRADPLARTVAAAALGGFGYWLVHGSVDWFWEFAGLGAPAFALLGLACALAPSRGESHAPAPARAGLLRSRSTLAGRTSIALAALLAIAGGCSLAAPWLSEREVQRAGRTWTTSPHAAYLRLRDAARLNPLSDQAYVVAGDIALRLGEEAHAEREFRKALNRTPDDAYATLERGALASRRGERRVALSLLGRAVEEDPREPLTREALRTVKQGGTVDIQALNSAIALKAQQLL